MRTIACIIARTNSTRLPKKVLKEIYGKKIIEYIIERVKRVRNVDNIYLCTSIDEEDQILLEIAKANGINSYAGSRESVIDRMLAVGEKESATDLIRITGDNIFTDEIFLEEMVDLHSKNQAEYTRTEFLPLGVTAEVLSFEALKKCYTQIDPNKSEYLTVYMFEPLSYKCLVLIPPKKLQNPFFNLSIDTPQDFERTLFIMDNLSGNGKVIGLNEIFDLHQKTGIPHISLASDSKVKLADGEQISYIDYRKKLEAKIAQSITVNLEDDFYGKNK